MAENKAGIRFSPEHYVFIDLAEDVRKITEEVNGVSTTYDIGEGGATGSSTLNLRNFPHTMTAGNTYQIDYTISDGATIEFHSNASNTKISIDENGLMNCIGSTTGFCVITITTKNSNGDTINETKLQVSVS